MLGAGEGGAVALPCARRRLVLVEQRRLGCAAGRRESQRPLVRLERKSSPDAAQVGLLCFPRLPVLECNQDTPFPLPRGRRRLVLVEQRALRRAWVELRRRVPVARWLCPVAAAGIQP